jgi:hypothetical protein
MDPTIDSIKNSTLTKYIAELPIQLRNKIYIVCFRKLWREFIPITAKVPSWYYPAMKQQKALFDARQQNIHFMHLPCNTLERNKQYIVGCQCNTCKNDYSRDRHIQKHTDNIMYFNDAMPYTDMMWNDKYDYIIGETDEGYGCIGYYPVFNSLYDIIEPLQVTIRNNNASFE